MWTKVYHCLPVQVRNVIDTADYHQAVCCHSGHLRPSHTLPHCLTLAVVDELSHAITAPVRLYLAVLARLHAEMHED